MSTFLIDQFPCSNTPCLKPAANTCKDCFLIQYCGRECQIQHWPLHKKDCNSPLMKQSWKPRWETEKRMPNFISDGDPSTPFGARKYLWGNMPALDVLNCAQNEGGGLPKDLRLLFAASGDMRNVVKTVAELPDSFEGKCEVIVNDHDFDIVARNAIFLLTALQLGSEKAVPMILHLWYSALIPDAIFRSFQEYIVPIIQDVCAKIHNKPLESLQAKTWKFGTRSLRLVLKKSQWDLLPRYLEVPVGLTAERALQIMRATMMAPERRDYFDRGAYARPPTARVCLVKFRTDGILLPFGLSRSEFDTPNPTFYQNADFWPMKDSADPLEGWSIREVMMKAPPAKNDVYGCLSLCIQDALLRFHRRIEELDIRIQLFCVNALVLPDMLEGRGLHSFDRIEISNIADSCYIGPHRALFTFNPLLKLPAQNPHAMLITLFLNAIFDVSTQADEFANMTSRVQQVMRYMSIVPHRLRDTYSAEYVSMVAASGLFQDFDGLFKRFADKYKLVEFGRETGVEMKDRNTVVEKWPLRLKKNATQVEFDQLHASGFAGQERYIEWRVAR